MNDNILLHHRDALYELLPHVRIDALLSVDDLIDYCKPLGLGKITKICVLLRDSLPGVFDPVSHLFFLSVYMGLLEYRSTLTDRPLPKDKHDLSLIYHFVFRDGNEFAGNINQVNSYFRDYELLPAILRACKHAQNDKTKIYRPYERCNPDFYNTFECYYCRYDK